MKKPYVPYKLAVVLLAAFSLTGCRKENGIDNEAVIKKPYGLYVSDDQGALYRTNGGTFYKIDFPPDGFAARAIVTSGPNLLMVKDNVHLSENNGHNFNPTSLLVTDSVNWQPIILDVPSHNRVYLAAEDDYGVKYSNDHGKTWAIDNAWDGAISGPLFIRITSFTQLKNNNLFSFDHFSFKLYNRNGSGSNWTEVTTNGLPGSGKFYLSHIGDVLLLVDYSGATGIWHSEDNGANWAAYSGLPANVPIYAVSAPFDEVLLAGLQNAGAQGGGVYKLAGNSFVSANYGIAVNTTVKGISGKNDIYKNDVDKRYYYLSTSTGVYRSGDQGQNWIQVKPGSYTAAY